MIRRACGGALLMVACGTGGPVQPEPAEVTVDLWAPGGMQLPEQLRLAVVWRTDDPGQPGFVITDDRAIPDDPGPIPLRLEPPTPEVLAQTLDPLMIDIECSYVDVGSWPGVVPYLVVTEDQNHDGVSSLDGADRVWAITDFNDVYLAALIDLEQVLSWLPLEEAECLRSHSAPGFSPFVSVYGTAPSVTATSEYQSNLSLRMSRSDLPGAELQCGNQVKYQAQLSDPDQSIEIYIDPALGQDACDQVPDTCSVNPVQVADLEPFSNWAESGFSRSWICTKFASVEVLWRGESGTFCDGCACAREIRYRGWVVSREALPADWPCGEKVIICEAPSDFWEPPTECSAPSNSSN